MPWPAGVKALRPILFLFLNLAPPLLSGLGAPPFFRSGEPLGQSFIYAGDARTLSAWQSSCIIRYHTVARQRGSVDDLHQKLMEPLGNAADANFQKFRRKAPWPETARSPARGLSSLQLVGHQLHRRAPATNFDSKARIGSKIPSAVLGESLEVHQKRTDRSARKTCLPPINGGEHSLQPKSQTASWVNR